VRVPQHGAPSDVTRRLTSSAGGARFRLLETACNAFSWSCVGPSEVNTFTSPGAHATVAERSWMSSAEADRFAVVEIISTK
jgi:hypothetical protein